MVTRANAPASVRTWSKSGWIVLAAGLLQMLGACAVFLSHNLAREIDVVRHLESSSLEQTEIANVLTQLHDRMSGREFRSVAVRLLQSREDDFFTPLIWTMRRRNWCDGIGIVDSAFDVARRRSTAPDVVHMDEAIVRDMDSVRARCRGKER